MQKLNLHTCLLYTVIFFVLTCSSVFACEGWSNSYETRYASICYSNENDLAYFSGSLIRGRFYDENLSESRNVVKDRVDMIVDRVRILLDMYPQDLHFKIYLYNNHKELEIAYLKTGSLRIFEKKPVAYYSPQNRIIHISIETITPGVLAHEIAHAIINSYFPAFPPAKMQEILAQYVDKHLWE